MTRPITTDLVEAYSLCPRKAFLLLAGEPNLGLHEYVRLTDEQAAVARQARRVSLAEAGGLSPGGGAADLNTGPKAVADVELTADGLQTRCDFLTRVSERSRLGR